MNRVATTFSSLQVFVSQPQFHVATWLSFPLLSSVSQPSFHVMTQFLLTATLIPSHSFPFMLRHHLFVLCFYSSCDSKLLICLVSCRATCNFRSRLGCIFPYYTFCRNLKGRSRLDYTFLIPTLSQPHFSVTTVFTQFSFYFLL